MRNAHFHGAYLIQAALMICLLGCANRPTHPPTFADYRRIGPNALNDEKKIQGVIAFFGTAMFREDDGSRIQMSGTAREMIGAALHSTVSSEWPPAVIQRALVIGSNDPIVWTGAIQYLIRQRNNHFSPPNELPTVARALDELERLEPENGLAACLRANDQWKEGNTNAARLSLQAAAQKRLLSLHGSELRECVRLAALRANYSRFTAAIVAVGTLGPGSEIMITVKRLLENSNWDTATAEACLELGRRQEAQAKMMIDELLAFAVQKRALERLNPEGAQRGLERIELRRNRIKQVTAFLNSPQVHALSEREMAAMLESSLSEGEIGAAENLASTLRFPL